MKTHIVKDDVAGLVYVVPEPSCPESPAPLWRLLLEEALAGAAFILLIGALLFAPYAFAAKQGMVIGVLDGDTIEMLVDRTPVRVRLAGIDAPEKGQDFGMAAKKALSDLAYGKQAILACQTTDQYGRNICQVSVGGKDVGTEMVRMGYAWAYRRYLDDPGLLAIEADARLQKRGLWGANNPTPPWEWRKMMRNDIVTARFK